MEFPLGRAVIAIAAASSAELSLHGCRSEGLYVLRETIQAVRTQEDVVVLCERLPHVPRIASRWHDPGVAHLLGDLTTDLIRVGRPDAAARVLTLGFGFERPSTLYTAPPYPRYEAYSRVLSVQETMTKLGTRFLDLGQPEGITLLGAAASLTDLDEDLLTSINSHVVNLDYRVSSPLSPSIIRNLADVARGFAGTGRYPSAARIAVLVGMLATRVLRSEYGAQVQARLWEPSQIPWIARTDLAQQATNLSRTILERGYPAQAAELYEIAVSLRASEPDAWKAAWIRLDQAVLREIPEARSSRAEQLRSWVDNLNPYRHYRRRSEPRIALGDVVTTVACSEPFVTTPRPDQPSPTAHIESRPDSGGRQVNAWLDDAQPPLKVGTSYSIGVNIGAPRSDAIGGGTFHEPAWGDRDHLDLMVALTADGAQVEPTWHRLVLPKDDDTTTIHFQLVPEVVGEIELRLSIFLAKEFALLEEFRMTVPTVEATAAIVR